MGKRANGEGTVYRRNDGRWVASISLDNGKRKSIYCKTQREAIREVQRANQAKEQGMLGVREDETLGAFLASWLQDTAKPNLRPRTYIRYRELVELHVLPTLGSVKLHQVSPQHLQKLYNKKLEEGYAPQTVKHIHRVLHRALRDALRWNLVARNVCDAVDAPRVPKQEMRALSGEQALQFLAAAKSDPLEALYVLALTTGMREGELLGLKWEDVDIAHKTVQVRRTIARIPHEGFKVAEPKTPKSRRSIHLTDLALESLSRHRARQREGRLSAGALWDERSRIFCNAVGNPIEVTNLLKRSFRPLLARAGVPTITFHCLRHSTASLLLSLGIHPKIVQELLGHSQIALTLDTYSHVLPSMQEEALDRLGALLTKAGGPVAVSVAVKADEVKGA